MIQGAIILLLKTSGIVRHTKSQRTQFIPLTLLPSNFKFSILKLYSKLHLTIQSVYHKTLVSSITAITNIKKFMSIFNI